MKKIAPITNEQWEAVNEFNRFLLDDFITNSTELSPKTKNVYYSNLRIWFAWVQDNLGNKKHTDCKPIEYKKFQNWLMNRECSSSDICNKRAAISSLNNYIEVYYGDEYPLFRNFINKSIARPTKAFVHEKEPLTRAEFEELIKKLEDAKEWQKICYLLFTFESGCRRAESRQLLKSVVDAKPIIQEKTEALPDGTQATTSIITYQTHPIRCKGRSSAGKVRKLTFGVRTMNAVKQWLEERGEDDCPYMFVTNYGGQVKQVGETTFNAWSASTFEPLVGRRFHPHLLRESRATQAVHEDGKDITSVQKLFGHESPETTRIYVIDNSEEDVGDLF